MSSNQPPATPEQLIQQAINENAKPEFPTEITLETGETYRGANPQELLNAVVKGAVEAKKALRGREAENADLRQQLTTVHPPPQTHTQTVPPNNQDSAQEYLSQWAQDPKKATVSAVAEALGMQPEQLPNMIRAMQQQFTARSIETASEEFQRRCQEYPATPEANAMMKQALIERYGMPSLLQVSTDADKLEATYHELVRQNRITPNAVTPSSTVGGGGPLPTLRGNSVQPDPLNDYNYKFSQMSLEDMKKTIDALQARGVR